MTDLESLTVKQSSIGGSLPGTIGFMLEMRDFDFRENKISGCLPSSIGSMLKLSWLRLQNNQLSGKIPDQLGSILHLDELYLSVGELSGKIPDAVASMTVLMILHLNVNHLSGKIPCAMAWMTHLQFMYIHTNQLSGTIPDAITCTWELQEFLISTNKLSGSIPIAVASLRWSVFSAFDNQLSGSIPHVMDACIDIFLDNNQLTGPLPALKHVEVVMASFNWLEGTLPNTWSPNLLALCLSGVAGHIGGLNGPLPSALRKPPRLSMVAVASHQMEGLIPSFSSTLSLLALHKNRFKVLPNLHFEDNVNRTLILLHNNLLSCSVPWCDNAAAKASIIAIGNQLQYPKGKFPAWVSKYEHDTLFWVSGTEGRSLVLKTGGAVVFFLSVIAMKLGRTKLLRAMSRWQIGPATHLWVVKGASHVLSCLIEHSCARVVFLMILLSWDLYTCPQPLAVASAYSGRSTLIHMLVLLLWCTLSFHSPAARHLAVDGETQKKQWTETMFRKGLLLWLLWCLLTLVLSTFAILYQVSKSIPGFFGGRKILLLGLEACVGAMQAVVSRFVVSYLASRLTCQKHTFITVSNLLMNYVFPFVVVMYLDTECLGRWTALWKPCRTNRQLFQHRLICTARNHRDCSAILKRRMNMDITILRESDMCDPHFSWDPTSMSRCIQISLLRLQGPE